MADRVDLAIDTASDLASIAIAREEGLVAELTWDSARRHGRQLLPAIDGLLTGHGLAKGDITALMVDVGPGSYAGIRAGVSAAKGLAFALQVPLAGIGRLEIEAYAFAAAGATVVAVHRAGRSELAWAAYAADPTWREVLVPRLSPANALIDALPDATLVTGEIDDALRAQLVECGHRVASGAAVVRRASLLAELGRQRLDAGRADDPNTLVPLYLREPAIGPQPSG